MDRARRRRANAVFRLPVRDRENSQAKAFMTRLHMNGFLRSRRILFPQADEPTIPATLPVDTVPKGASTGRLDSVDIGLCTAK
jgi:hypothetical protein